MAQITSGVQDPYAGTEYVANQDLMPHQREYINAAVNGPLVAVLGN